MSDNRTRVCVDTNSYPLFNFDSGKREYLPPGFCLIENLEAYLFGGTILVVFEHRMTKVDTWHFYLVFSIKFGLIKGLAV